MTPDGFPATPGRLLKTTTPSSWPTSRSAPAGWTTRCSSPTWPRYVHDLGGGLVMIGGPDTFGAGGWQGKQAGGGAAGQHGHPGHPPDPQGRIGHAHAQLRVPRRGNYYGEQCAIKAIEHAQRPGRDRHRQLRLGRGQRGRQPVGLPAGSQKGDGTKPIGVRRRTCRWATCPASTTPCTSPCTAANGNKPGLLDSDASPEARDHHQRRRPGRPQRRPSWPSTRRPRSASARSTSTRTAGPSIDPTMTDIARRAARQGVRADQRTTSASCRRSSSRRRRSSAGA